MKLYVTSAYSSHDCLDKLVELAGLDAYGEHELVADFESADAIVFVENTQFQDLAFKRVRAHPLALRYPGKVFMYNEMDRAWPVLPGLYSSLTRKLARSENHIAFAYLTESNAGIKHIHKSRAQIKYLYSFVGSRSHPIRNQLFSLKGDKANITDTSEFCAWQPEQPESQAFQKLYCDTIASSKFVLCPRGIGPSSLRLFETIEAGRIPVIISDEWVAPPQICWDFAVRIAESDIATIPDVLAALEPQWQERASAARAGWEQAFSPEHMFNTVGDAIARLCETATCRRTDLSTALHKYQVLLGMGLKQKARHYASRLGAAGEGKGADSENIEAARQRLVSDES
ncbi:MAG: exostosin family protein [Granulosicoccus sp.]